MSARVIAEGLVQDVRYAARTLRKTPAFSLTAIVTLAIGLGAAAAIFSMVNGVLLQRLPIRNGDRLMHLRQPSLRASDEGVSALEVAELRRDANSFIASHTRATQDVKDAITRVRRPKQRKAGVKGRDRASSREWPLEIGTSHPSR
jgi:hypothetical protein